MDSKYETIDSLSNSDLKHEITEAIDFPDNTAAYINDISIPHTWYAFG